MGSIQLTDAQITVQHPSPSGTSLQHASHQSTLTIIEKKIFASSPTFSHQHTLCMESDLELNEWNRALSLVTPLVLQSSRSTSLDSSATTTTTFSNKHEPSPIKTTKDQAKQPSSAPESPMSRSKYGKFTTRQYIPPTTPHYQPQRSNSDTSIHPGEPNHNDNSILLRGNGNDPIYRHISSMDNSALSSTCTLESQDPASSSVSLRPDLLRQRSSLDAIFYSNPRDQGASHQPHTSISTISKPNDISHRTSSEGDAKKPKSRSRSNRRTFWPKKIFSSNGGSNHGEATGVFRGLLSRHSSDDSSSASHLSKQLSLASHHQIQPFNLSPYQDSNPAHPPTSPVFAVPLEEAVRISKISDTYELPAIVYRCIEFLENKNAIFEEGIYRLSGSAVKIKALRNEFDESMTSQKKKRGTLTD